MNRCAPSLLATACLMCPGAGPALAAGGHFDVDDATVLDPGHCQYEVWAARETAGPSTLLHVAPGCRVGPVELDLIVERITAGAAEGGASSLGPQLKWVADPLAGRLSAGVAWSALFDTTHGGRPVQTLYVPLTWWVGERLWLHANVGADWAAWSARSRRIGASVEWAATDRLTFIAERVQIVGDRVARIGARLNVTDSISIDASAARVAPGGARVYVIGLNQDFGR